MKGYLILLLACVSLPLSANLHAQGSFSLTLCPGGRAKTQIMKELLSAKKTVDLAMFYLSQEEIIDTLAYLAAEKKIQIRVFLDQTMTAEIHRERLDKLASSGIELQIENLPNGGKLHLKTAIIDRETLITGSVNWTEAGLSENYEDLLVFSSPSICAQYLTYIDTVLQPHCQRYVATRKPSINLERPEPGRINDGRLFASRGKKNFPIPPKLSTVITPSSKGFDDLISALSGADKSIDVIMFILTNRRVVDAVKAAALKGVKIRLIADEIMLSGTSRRHLRELAQSGVKIYSMHENSTSIHLKFANIDNNEIWRGSANWTDTAEKSNIEDMIQFPDSPELAKHYLTFYETLLEKCEDKTAALQEKLITGKLLEHVKEESHEHLPPNLPRTKWMDLDFASPAGAISFKNAKVKLLDDADYFPALLQVIEDTRQSFIGTLYLFSYDPEKRQPNTQKLLKALEAAAQRGVYIYIVLETPISQGDEWEIYHERVAARLRPLGCDIRLALPGNGLHDKFFVSDLDKVLIGSHNWSEGALSAETVAETSVLLKLPLQDFALAQYVFSRKCVSDMRAPITWRQEIELVRNINTMRQAEKKPFIAELEQEAGVMKSGKNLTSSILEAVNVTRAGPPVMTGPGVELINGVPPIDWRYYFPPGKDL